MRTVGLVFVSIWDLLYSEKMAIMVVFGLTSE